MAPQSLMSQRKYLTLGSNYEKLTEFIDISVLNLWIRPTYHHNNKVAYITKEGIARGDHIKVFGAGEGKWQVKYYYQI
jgi:hypothetical protein